jgi:hypothetical protein
MTQAHKKYNLPQPATIAGAANSLMIATQGNSRNKNAPGGNGLYSKTIANNGSKTATANK